MNNKLSNNKLKNNQNKRSSKNNSGFDPDNFDLKRLAKLVSSGWHLFLVQYMSKDC